jgi:solute carrier family 35 (UDP-galactose transporter), member B1
MNLYEMLFAGAICMVTGEFWGGMAFIGKHPAILSPIGYFMVCMGIGNIFIYALQKNFGALTVTTTTTLRKLLSVVFSVFWFGHQLHWMQWMAALVVFLAKPISQQIAGPDLAKAA